MRSITLKSGIMVMLLLLGTLTCGDSNVVGSPDANDYDAIYHIIVFDRANEFNLDLMDLSIPDTLAPELTQYDSIQYWFNVTQDSLELPIDIDYPDFQDSLGSIPEAFVRELKYFYGTLEIIAVDTTGGGQEPVRLSKEFVIRGEITAEFSKYGGDTNYRRGWLMTHISDAQYTAQYPEGITQVTISSDSYPELIVSPARKSLDDVLVFAAGESLTVAINGANPDDEFRIRFPVENGFQTINIEPDSNGIIAGFRMPVSERFSHFLVEAIGESSFTQDGIFRYDALGVLFKVQ
jgi:hypothetical protein